MPPVTGGITRSRQGGRSSSSIGRVGKRSLGERDALGMPSKQPEPDRLDALSGPTRQSQLDHPTEFNTRDDRRTGHIEPNEAEKAVEQNLESSEAISAELSTPVMQLTAAMSILRTDPGNPQAKVERDEAALRVFRILGDTSRNLSGSNPEFSEAFESLMVAYADTEASEKSRSSLASLALVLGISLLAATGAGALGALAVGDILWKETVKASIGGAVSAITALATERLVNQGLQRGSPDGGPAVRR